MTSSLPQDEKALVRALGGGRGPEIDGFLIDAYQNLRRFARGMLRSQRPGFTWGATDLVNATLLKLGVGYGAEKDPGVFFGAAVKALSHTLVDHVRNRGAWRRGGRARRVPLENLAASADAADGAELMDLIERLGAGAPQHAEFIRLRFLGGLTIVEIAAYAAVSTATVQRRLREGTAWLRVEWNRA